MERESVPSPTVTPTESEFHEPPYPPAGYAWYVLGVLMVVYVLSFIDRQIMSLLVEPIKADLGVTDREMGWLMGPAFAIFYTLFGIPLGWLADRKSRRGIIAIGIAIWSLMTACCGLVRTYLNLFLFRIGVGIGEAALSPAAYSLLTDYFPRQRLATVISIYGMGIYIGSGLAYLLGGLVVRYAMGQGELVVPLFGEIRAWQIVFLVVGVPGLLFALLLLTVREPVRRAFYPRAASCGPERHASLAEVARYLRDNRWAFVCHNAGFAFLAFVGYAGIMWIPTFFQRIHGWSPAQTGFWYGIIIMTCGSAGIVYGGALADRFVRRGYANGKMLSGVISAVAVIPFGIYYPLAPNGTYAMIALAPLTFALAMPFGCAPAAMQEMMPKTMRAQAGAIYLFVVNLIGIGLGPLAVAQFTERVFRDLNKVHYSLLVVGTLGGLVALVFLVAGLKPFARSLEYLKTYEAGNA